MAKILVVDDEEMLLSVLLRILHQYGHEAEGALTIAEAREKIAANNYELIFLDVQMPDGNGLEVLPEFREAASAPEIIIITGQGGPVGAEQAIVSGAWAYISKIDLAQDLQLHVTRALQYRAEKLKTSRPVLLKRDAIIGSSPPLMECLEQVAMAAASEASVLITGETGTGKELLARAIHENSQRRQGSFVIVDCAALPENLIESTLFGHVKGAFTGADRSRQGLVKMANGGTLFLDEVGELPLSVQKAFLRVLQEQSFRPVGASHEEKSDFRIIAATNRDLEKSIADGAFRSDLFFRLQAFSLHVPPLRDRKEDIKPLTKYFLTRLCDRMHLPPKGISPEFLEHLEGYDWPGNVRQLQQTMEQVFAMAARQPTLFARHLPEHFRIRQAQAGLPRTDSEVVALSGHCVGRAISLPSWKDYKATMEREYIEELLHQTGGKIKAACKISGLSRARIYQLREKHGLMGGMVHLPDSEAV